MRLILNRKNKSSLLRLEGGAGVGWTNSDGKQMEVWREVKASTIPEFAKRLTIASYEVAQTVKVELGAYEGMLPIKVNYAVFYPDLPTLEPLSTGGSTSFLGSLMTASFSTTERMYRFCYRELQGWESAFLDYRYHSDDDMTDSLEEILSNIRSEEDYNELFSLRGLTSEKFHKKYLNKRRGRL